MAQRGGLFDHRIAVMIALVLCAVALIPTTSTASNATASAQASTNTFTSGIASWNPNVSCSATLVTIQYILGTAYPTQGLTGSPYQTSSTGGGIPDKRALSPPCTITNIKGRVLSSFVEIDNVTLHYYFYETRDCSSKYNGANGGGPYPSGQTFCDSTGNIYTAGTTNGFVHVEFDQDWMAAGYAGPTTTIANNNTIADVKLPCTVTSTCVSTVPIDVQGFVYWDPEGHWELHALTAWRFSGPVPDFTMTASPSSLSLSVGSSGNSTLIFNSLSGFSGTVNVIASVSSTSLITVVPPTASLAPSSVTLTSNGTGSSTLTVSTSLLTTPGTYTLTVTGTSGSISHSTSVTVTVGL